METSSGRVLVVDDDADIRALVARRVRSEGHAVIDVGSGAEALTAVDERGAPDVAVLDVSMPGMDGLELLETLRQKEGLAHLPAIFLSARVQQSDVERGRSMGAVYLTKPFIASALLRAITDALTPADESW